LADSLANSNDTLTDQEAGAEALQSPDSVSPITAVLLDAVGTLIYPNPPVAEVYQNVAARFGSQLSRDQISQRFKHALATALPAADRSLSRPCTSEANEYERWRQIVAAVVNDVSSSASAEVFASLWQYFAEATSWRLFDDVAPIWQELKRRRYQLGVASNFDRRLRTVLAGLLPLDAPQLFISSEIGFSKPDPGFFEAVQQRLDLEPTQILLVGDDWTNDVAGGKSAGWSTILIHRDQQSPGPPGSIHRLSEILNLLPPRT